jgi:hypothetical protein
MVDAVPKIAVPNVAREVFGVLPDGRTVERVLLRGAGGFEAGILTYGAALRSLIVPDAEGRCDDVVLTVAADCFLAIDPGAIPLPESPRSVAGTPFDFRNPSTLAAGCDE